MKIRKTVYLTPEAEKQARHYAFINNITMSDLVNKAIMELTKKKVKK